MIQFASITKKYEFTLTLTHKYCSEINQICIFKNLVNCHTKKYPYKTKNALTKYKHIVISSIGEGIKSMERMKETQVKK